MAAEIANCNGTVEVGKVQKLFGGIIDQHARPQQRHVSTDGEKFLVVDDGASEDVRPLTPWS